VLPYGATFVGTSGVPTKLSRGLAQPHRQLRPQLWSGTTGLAIFMPAGVASDCKLGADQAAVK
jgi:hypothetical protein